MASHEDMPSLESIKSQITQIRQAFGTPSISCGVLHHGKIIFRHADGFADVEATRRPDADTVYAVASCTKAFTAAACAALVCEGRLSWTEPVSSYLPEFRTLHNTDIGQQANLIDLCSHATGLAPLEHAILGFHDEFYNGGAEQVKIASNLPVLFPFRSGFIYNNFMYGLVGQVISNVSGMSLGNFMKEKMFRPLGLSRTGTTASEYCGDGNVAKGYSVLDDGSLLLVGDSKLDDGVAQGGAGSVRSTVNDMLSWAKGVMEAEERQTERYQYANSDPEPLPGVAFTRSAQVPLISEPTIGENSYALGWFRHTIPSQWLGSISPNFMLLPNPPVIGQKSPPRLTISHYGAFGGFLASFYTFPETCSAIVVLANSSPSRGDPTDLIAQALCQELFDMKPRLALESFAVEAAQTSALIWQSLIRRWVVSRLGSLDVPPLADYTGGYINAGLALRIDVFELPDAMKKARKQRKRSPELLAFTVNGQARQTAKLRHYHADVWTFLPDSRDDASRKGMELYMSLSSVLLSFIRDPTGNIRWLEWDVSGGGGVHIDPNQSLMPISFERSM